MCLITMVVTTVFCIIVVCIVCIVLKRRRHSKSVHPVEGLEMNLRNRGNGGNGRQPTDHDRYVDLDGISSRETTSLTSMQGPNSTSNDSVRDSQRSPTSQTSTQEPAPPKADGAQEDPSTIAESVSGSTEGKDSIFSKEIGGSAEWNSGASTEADDNDNTNQGEESHPRTRSTRSLSITSPRKESGHPEEKKRLISSLP